MPIDLNKALNAEPSRFDISWTRRDVLLYHLSVGAGRSEGGPELGLTYERGLRVLPTFAMVAGQGISTGDDLAMFAMDLPGIDIDLLRILHAGQALTVHQPLPASGSASVETRIAHVWDKGKAAVIVVETSARNDDGPLWTTEMQIWASGEGGFDGEPGPDTSWTAPGREPDLVIDSPIPSDLALLYRLNGDLNPLHIDPEFAGQAGFDAPILHGLASYGVVAKALVDGLLDGDPTRLTSLSVRFAGTITPGQTIRTTVWRDGDDLTLAATCPERDGAAVLSHATAKVAS